MFRPLDCISRTAAAHGATIVEITQRRQLSLVRARKPELSAIEQHVAALDPDLAETESRQDTIDDLPIPKQFHAQAVEFRLAIRRRAPQYGIAPRPAKQGLGAGRSQRLRLKPQRDPISIQDCRSAAPRAGSRFAARNGQVHSHGFLADGRFHKYIGHVRGRPIRQGQVADQPDPIARPSICSAAGR